MIVPDIGSAWNRSRAPPLPVQRETPDEVGISGCRDRGDHHSDHTRRLVRPRFWRVIGWLRRRLRRRIGWQQQRQRRRLPERRLRGSRFTRRQRDPARAVGSRRIEQCRRRSERPGKFGAARIARRTRYEHLGHRAIVRRRHQQRQWRDDRLCKIGLDRMTGPQTTGDAEVGKENREVDRKIKSICRGC